MCTTKCAPRPSPKSKPARPKTPYRLAKTHRKDIEAAVEARTLPRQELINARQDEESARLRHEAAKRKLSRENELAEDLQPTQNSPHLDQANSDLYLAKKQILELKIADLQDQIDKATIRASVAGRIENVLPQGSPALTSTNLASIIPERAQEIIAFLPAKTQPDSIRVGSMVHIVEPSNACPSPAKLVRIGARVELAPGQITGLFNSSVHGLPVYLEIPSECTFGVGQLLSVDIPR